MFTLWTTRPNYDESRRTNYARYLVHCHEDVIFPAYGLGDNTPAAHQTYGLYKVNGKFYTIS